LLLVFQVCLPFRRRDGDGAGIEGTIGAMIAGIEETIGAMIAGIEGTIGGMIAGIAEMTGGMTGKNRKAFATG
jgi:hypothetical protein